MYVLQIENIRHASYMAQNKNALIISKLSVADKNQLNLFIHVYIDIIAVVRVILRK